MKKDKKNLKLIVLILCHITLICTLFLFVKKEFHSDEIWSFGIANGSIAGAVFQDDNEEPINDNEWVSAEVFHENLTVQPDERFRFGMTYKNALYDAHPPLSFLLIHFISSFFVDQFSFWFYIPINIIALVLCDLYLFKLLKLFEFSDSVCLGACALYAFCAGGINTMMFIRMYALLVAFAVMILYLSMKVYLKNELVIKDALGLILVCFLGSFTEYEFYVYAFILTVVMSLLILLQKNIKLTFQYGMCMAAGVGISLLVFPEFFNDLVRNTNGEGFGKAITYPYGLQLRILLNMTMRDIIGFAPSVFNSFSNFILFFGICVYGLIVCLPLYFYLRKTEKGKKFFGKIKDRIKKLFDNINRVKVLLFVAFVEYIAMLCIFNSLVSVYHMKGAVVRYFYIIYPILVVIFVLLAYWIADFVFPKWKNCVCVFIVILLCVCSNLMGGYPFLGKSMLKDQDLSKVTDSNIIMVCRTHAEVERLAHVIDSSNYFFSVTYEDFDEYIEQIKNMPENRDVYVVLGESALTKKMISENLEQESGDVLQIEDIDAQQQCDDKEKLFKQKLVDEGICEECTYIGRESMLNSTFIYYKLR